jgi:hypothetical protein
MLKRQKVDILKMDIEGAEYDVICDLLNCNINVQQILVEFHHRFKDVGVLKTKQAIAELNKNGFKIFDISSLGTEYSFIRI